MGYPSCKRDGILLPQSLNLNGRYRDFKVTLNRQYLSKSEIDGDFVLPIPPCGVRPLSMLTHGIAMYYTSNYGFNLSLSQYGNS